MKEIRVILGLGKRRVRGRWGFLGGGGEEEFDGEMDELNSSWYENSILDIQTTKPLPPPPPLPIPILFLFLFYFHQQYEPRISRKYIAIVPTPRVHCREDWFGGERAGLGGGL